MSIPGGVPSAPKRYPLMAAWKGKTYDDGVFHPSCEADPKHLLRCDKQEDLERFMQNVGEAVCKRGSPAIAYFLEPDRESVQQVDTEGEANIKVTDKETGQRMWFRVDAWNPKNCYLCEPLSDGKVGWTGHPDNTVPKV